MKKGFTLVETIFYMTFLVVILGVVVMMIVSLSRTYQKVQATKNLESSAVFTMERISREIRNAISVDLSNSAFGTSTAGSLTLNTTDSSGNSQVVKFYLASSSAAVSLNVNGAYKGPLTLNGVKVTRLLFNYATSTNSQAVKFSLGLKSTIGNASSTANFYTTVVLRGSY